MSFAYAFLVALAQLVCKVGLSERNGCAALVFMMKFRVRKLGGGLYAGHHQEYGVILLFQLGVAHG